MNRQSFLEGTATLLAASLVNRFIGFLYQIIMIRLIKPEGVGLFNMIHPIYVMTLVLATAGVPLAVSKLVAEEMAKNNLRGAYRIFNFAFVFLLLSSLFFSTILFTGSPLLLKYIFPNPKVYYCFLALIPGIIIVSLCSVFRGFFQGLQQMTLTAVTQSTEQLVRVISALFFASLLLPKGVEFAATGISLGVICGESVGFIFMLIIFFRQRPHLSAKTLSFPQEPISKVGHRLLNWQFQLLLPVSFLLLFFPWMQSSSPIVFKQLA